MKYVPEMFRWVMRSVIYIALMFVAVPMLHGQVNDDVDTWTVQDITQLNASIQQDTFLVEATIEGSFGDWSVPIRNFDFFLNTDQNLATGDARPGGVEGVDYILRCAVIMGAPACELCLLPQTPGQQEKKISLDKIPGARAGTSGKTLRVQLPVSSMGGTNAIDVFAFANLSSAPQGGPSPSGPVKITGEGDRCPDHGVLDTHSGTVVDRRGSAVVDVTFTDTQGDRPGGMDITAVRFRTLGDQFEITLSYSEPVIPEEIFNGTEALLITLDSDGSLETGAWPMGESIPTWGGDVKLVFTMSTTGVYSPILLMGDWTPQVTFGYPSNDGRWRIDGNNLIFAASLSVFDAYAIRQGIGNESSYVGTRIPTDGKMIADVVAWWIPAYSNGQDKNPDLVPGNGKGLDAGSGKVLDPLVWLQDKVKSETDPAEFGVYGQMDIIQVDAQIEDRFLVVKGMLPRCDPAVASEGKNAALMFKVELDTDRNINTGNPVSQPLGQGQQQIGVDLTIIAVAKVTVTSGLGAYGTSVLVADPTGAQRIQGAWGYLRLPSTGAADFTVTIPLEYIGNPQTAVRFYVTTSRTSKIGDFTPYDIAPQQPFEIETPGEPVTLLPPRNLLAEEVNGAVHLRWEVPRKSVRLFQMERDGEPLKTDRDSPLRMTPTIAGPHTTAVAAESPPIAEVEPNNSVFKAQVLTGTSPLLVSGTAETQDAGDVIIRFTDGTEDDIEDIFLVTTVAKGLRVELGGFTADLDLRAWDCFTGEKIGYSNNTSPTGTEVIDIPTAEPGAYMIGVTIYDPKPGPNTSTTYQLTVTGEFGEGRLVLLRYNVYRSTSSPVLLNPQYLIGDAPGTVTEYMDRSAKNAQPYYYAVAAFYNQGESVPSNEVMITLSTDGVEDISSAIPSGFVLGQNRPNPFNPSTTIQFAVPEGAPSHIRISVYDIQGGIVCRLVDSIKKPGIYSVEWNGRDSAGKSVSSGVYLYKLQADSYVKTRKMLLLR